MPESDKKMYRVYAYISVETSAESTLEAEDLAYQLIAAGEFAYVEVKVEQVEDFSNA